MEKVLRSVRSILSLRSIGSGSTSSKYSRFNEGHGEPRRSRSTNGSEIQLNAHDKSKSVANISGPGSYDVDAIEFEGINVTKGVEVSRS